MTTTPSTSRPHQLAPQRPLAAALEDVRQRVRQAALAAGRSPAEVALVAVSKKQSTAAIREAYAAGQRDFGENYVQELVQKAGELADLPDLRWHMIGRLQRNKAKAVAGVARIVHAIDSIDLAHGLAHRFAVLCPSRDTRLRVLVEVNIGGEAQKHGVSPSDLPTLLDAIEALPALDLSGLMCVPPLTDDPGEALVFFRALAALRNRHGGVERLPELSMGMTRDLEHAVAAGATLVRVGTAIFGERPAPAGERGSIALSAAGHMRGT